MASKVLLKLLFLVLGTIPLLNGWTLQEYNPKPNLDAVVQTKEARFTIFTENMIRMEYDPSGTFEDRTSRIFVNRHLNKPSFESQINDTSVQIKTSALTIHYFGGPFSATSLSITSKSSETPFVYKPSGDVNKDNGFSNNLFGTILALDGILGDFTLNCTENVKRGVDGYKHPHCQWGIIGMDGYAVIDDTETTMMDGDWFSSDRNQNKQDLYFFGHGLDFKKAIYEYTLIAGSVPLIPRYGLGSMHTRWYHYSDYSFRQSIVDYESRSIPLDVAVIDMDWHYLDRINSPWGTYTWSELLFPNPNVTQTWLHQTKNLRTSANIHDDNGIQTVETYYNAAATALGVSNGQNIKPNISDYQYMMTVQDILLDPIQEPQPDALNSPLAHGFDVWWIDWQQGMDGIYLDHDDLTPTYILSYVRGTNNLRLKRNMRNMVLGRCGGYGSHRYPTGFSGDQIHSWSSLQYNTYFTATAANVLYGWRYGVSYGRCCDMFTSKWTKKTQRFLKISLHDIYGSQDSQDLALNTRWIQFGAYSPIFRIHDKGQGTGVCANTLVGCALPDIWNHPNAYFEIERSAIQQRAELLPYIYNASYHTYTSGLQMVRSMYIDYPHEPNAYPSVNPVVKQQYMFGDAMIVSPIAHKGDIMEVTSQSIWLPDTADFYEVHSGYMIPKQSSSTGTISRKFSLSEIPIYIQSDAVIVRTPFISSDVLGKANEVSFERLRFDIYPSLKPSGRSTWIYEDDGISYEYFDGEQSVRTSMEWMYDDSDFTFTATIKSDGDYAGFIKERYYGVRIYNVLAPKKVICNEQLIEYNVLFWDEFERENTWYYDGHEMAVTVNCPQTDALQVTAIEIEFARGWDMDFKYTALGGMKGKISRANQCKESLDEANYQYGTSARSNMTYVASYGMLLGNVGMDYSKQFEYIQQFEGHWGNAMKEVKELEAKVAGTDRYQFCNDLYDSISL